MSRDPSAAAFRIFSSDASNTTFRNVTITGGSDGTGFSQAGGIWDRSTFLTLVIVPVLYSWFGRGPAEGDPS